MDRKKFPKGVSTLLVLGLMFTISACGSSGSGDTALAPSPPGTALPASQTVVGTLDAAQASSAQTFALLYGSAHTAAVPAGTTVSLDGVTPVHVTLDGRFEATQVNDGDHSFFVHLGLGEVVEVPFRMLDGRGLDMGTVRIRNGHIEEISGFDGYRFGFMDGNGDGVNDNFADADGDGICDNNARFAGYPYMMDHGYADQDRDGRNDLFRDADGDGINDVTGMPYGHGFGFVDGNGDGVNDRFRDEDGNGICDVSGMPFGHPFGYQDGDGDGVNDLFRDTDGDGINDVTGMPYVAMPGWVDLDGNGVNDFFQDADGDGICDLTGIPYGHGFGWKDDDHDGRNDRFTDVDGDTVVDAQIGPHSGMHYRYGSQAPHVDANGDGIDDGTGVPFRHGFGWVDGDGDGRNDAFRDVDGDGVNDLTGHGYVEGFGHDGMQHSHDPIDWPMEPPVHMDGGMR